MASNMVKGLSIGVLAGVLAIGGRGGGAPPACSARERCATATMALAAAESHDTVQVVKTASCGCCREWVDYMKQQGFVVVARDVSPEDLEMTKTAAGVPSELASCHTAHVGGYVIEGHVPAEDIRKLLATRPAIAGLAVPGMVSGSPGMGSGPATFSVVAFDAKGKTSVFSQH